MRVIDEAASLVCMVEKTRWPVSAAWDAYCAVSPSRISPTIMMSGSCRKMWRSAAAKVMPILLLIAVWLNSSYTSSIGSSMVVMFCSRLAMVLQAGLSGQGAKARC